MKFYFPEFCHGFNCTDLENQLEKMASKFRDPVMYSFDGSSFDAHRHVSLLEAIDYKIIDALFTFEVALNMGYNNL
jgi:lysozyme family protein